MLANRPDIRTHGFQEEFQAAQKAAEETDRSPKSSCAHLPLTLVLIDKVPIWLVYQRWKATGESVLEKKDSLYSNPPFHQEYLKGQWAALLYQCIECYTKAAELLHEKMMSYYQDYAEWYAQQTTR